MKKTFKPLCIAVTDKLHDTIKQEAKYQGLNVSEFMRQLFDKWMVAKSEDEEWEPDTLEQEQQ